MAIFFGHESALEFWRHVGRQSRLCASLLCQSRSIRTLEATTRAFNASKPKAQEAKRAAIETGIAIQRDHIVVPDAAHRCRSNAVCAHVTTHPLPAKSFVQISNDTYIATPELCFLQMASMVSHTRLIELGLELCGSYSLPDSQGGSFFQRKPLSSVSALSDYLDKTGKAYGASKARSALRYIENGSASPMESKTMMLLCLPTRMGGYGAPLPRLNHQITVRKTARQAASKRYYVGDLYWPEAKVEIAYDSDAFHTGSDRIASDAQRRNALAYLDISVITVTRAQVMNAAEFNKVACSLLKRLGKRTRPTVGNWSAQRCALRREVLDFGPMGQPAN